MQLNIASIPLYVDLFTISQDYFKFQTVLQKKNLVLFRYLFEEKNFINNKNFLFSMCYGKINPSLHNK